MSAPTLLIVDNHAHFRYGLRQICEVNGGFEVVAEAASSAEALALARRYRPKAVLLDMHLSDLDGAETARLLLQQDPGLVIVLLSFAWEAESLEQARQSGARAWLDKACSETALFNAILSGPAPGV